MKSISLYNDKCEPVLDSLDENSVDNVVTDPPYGLQFMNKKWDYDVPSVELWKKVYRIMKPGATLLCFAGTRTQHRMAVNIEDAGFILKDVIMWLYGTGFPKGADISKQLDKIDQNEIAELWNGWKSHALKPAYEPIIMAIKPNEGSYVENALKYGTAGLNIGDSRINVTDKEYELNTNRDNVKSHWGNSKASANVRASGGGRYPANVILSHHPDCKLKKECHPDCPVKILDEQGGTRKSGSIEEHHNLGDEKGEKFRDNEIYGVYKMHDGYKPSSYGDTGKASRYYKSFDEGWDCHPDCPVKMLDDQSGITKDVSRTAKITDSKPISDEKGWNAHSMKHGVQDAPGAYEDEGGASRFFHKVEDWDCHPDCPVKMLDDQSGVSISSGGQIASLTGEDHNGFPFHKAPGIENIRNTEKGDPGFGDEGGASRFFYCAKASQSERNDGCDELDDKKFGFSGGANQAIDEGKDEYLQEHIGLNRIRNMKNHHPTVKPVKLMEYLCMLISNPENNLFVDPFMGSGTTGIAVSNLGFDFIGIEMDKDYFDIAENRIGFSRVEEIQLEKRQELFDNFFE